MKSSLPNGHSAGLRRIQLFYDNNDSDNSALRLAYTIKPKWREAAGDMEVIKFTDGITNTLLKVVKRTPGASQWDIDDQAVLMRAYGNNTEILIDRDREAKSHALLATKGLAPSLLARFENGLLYEYIQGTVCTPQDLIREPVWRAVARRLGEWHGSLPVVVVRDSESLVNRVNGNSHPHVGSLQIAERTPTPNIWGVMQKWILALPCGTEEQRVRQAQLQKELDRSFRELDRTTGLGQSGLVFGHCDLLSANVIILPPSTSRPEPSREETVSFIDYEYATPCPAAFDIANHFAEWAGYDCDYNILPTRSLRKAYLKEYLTSYSAHANQPLEDETAALQQLFEDVDNYRGMPGFYWGIWALIQATISQIDFPYATYAEERLGEYWDWRNETSGARKREGREMPLRERRWAEE